MPNENDALFRALVETAIDGIVVIDAHGIARIYSDACRRLYGYAADEVVGRSVNMLLPEPFHGELDGYLADYRATGETRLIGVGREGLGRRKDGSTFPLHLSIGEGRSGGDAVFVVVIRDLALLKSQMAISNYVTAARRMPDKPDDIAIARAREVMKKAMVQVMRAGAILRSLREFVGTPESNRSPQDLDAVIEEAIVLGLMGSLNRDVNVRLELDRSLPPVLIDKVQIQQMLINLFRNGVEAVVEVEYRELRISTTTQNRDFAQVSVGDGGPGFTEAIRKRLFQPFVTTKENGMGIGLSICQSIVEAHGGEIRAQSNAPCGAAFVFCIPFVGQREAA